MYAYHTCGFVPHTHAWHVHKHTCIHTDARAHTCVHTHTHPRTWHSHTHTDTRSDKGDTWGLSPHPLLCHPEFGKERDVSQRHLRRSKQGCEMQEKSCFVLETRGRKRVFVMRTAWDVAITHQQSPGKSHNCVIWQRQKPTLSVTWRIRNR